MYIYILCQEGETVGLVHVQILAAHTVNCRMKQVNEFETIILSRTCLRDSTLLTNKQQIIELVHLVWSLIACCVYR